MATLDQNTVQTQFQKLQQLLNPQGTNVLNQNISGNALAQLNNPMLDVNALTGSTGNMGFQNTDLQGLSGGGAFQGDQSLLMSPDTGTIPPLADEGIDWSGGFSNFANVAQGLASLYGIKSGRDAIKLGRQNARDRKAFGLADLSNSAIAANTKLRDDRMNFLRAKGIVGEEATRQVDQYMKDAAVSGELPQAKG